MREPLCSAACRAAFVCFRLLYYTTLSCGHYGHVPGPSWFQHTTAGALLVYRQKGDEALRAWPRGATLYTVFRFLSVNYFGVKVGFFAFWIWYPQNRAVPVEHHPHPKSQPLARARESH